MQSLAQDLRFALRQLRKHPGFTFTAVLVLALGLGANTAIFTVINAFLLRPLPYKERARLMGLFERDPVGESGGNSFNDAAPGNYLDWRRLSATFEQIAACTDGGSLALSSPSTSFEPERVEASACSSNLFSTLGLEPVLGRVFREDEDRWGAPRAASIGYGLWQRRFGAGTNVTGKSIRLDGELYQIVGVMPRRFAFPYRTDELWIRCSKECSPISRRVMKPISCWSWDDCGAVFPLQRPAPKSTASRSATSARTQRSQRQRRECRSLAFVLGARPSKLFADSVRGRRLRSPHRLRECREPAAESRSGPHARNCDTGSHRR